MKFPRRRFLHLAAGVTALPAVSRIARAQSYPSRPITVIVPAAAGGPTDTIMRLIAERMRAFLGQPIIVENNWAAGGHSLSAALRGRRQMVIPLALGNTPTTC
jgi:tripartite-type tricarboxylate transporter receptor subunit TctC